METQSLYVRLGGAEGIERLVEEVATRHVENPVIGARFRPFLEQPEKLREIKAHLARFLELGSGGPERYTGRDMRSAHRGMNISPHEYMSAIDDILGAVRAAGLGDDVLKDVLAMTWSVKDDIVQM